jgi:hypothetical protein
MSRPCRVGIFSNPTKPRQDDIPERWVHPIVWFQKISQCKPWKGEIPSTLILTRTPLVVISRPCRAGIYMPLYFTQGVTLCYYIPPLQWWDFLKSYQAPTGRHTKAMGAAHRMIPKDQPKLALKGWNTFYSHSDTDTISRYITPLQGWDLYAVIFYTGRYPVLSYSALAGLGFSQILPSPDRATYQSDGCSPSYHSKRSAKASPDRAKHLLLSRFWSR